jgi:hypothetical protein
MSQGPSGSQYSLQEILQIIARLREQLQDDPKLSAEQRAALEALLSFYMSLTNQLEKHVDSIMSSE